MKHRLKYLFALLLFALPAIAFAMFKTKKARCESLHASIVNLGNSMPPTPKQDLYDGTLSKDGKKLNTIYQKWIDTCSHHMPEQMNNEIRNAIKGRIPIRD